MAIYQNDKKLSHLEQFKKYFSIESANTIEKKNKVYRIRYRVYCQEFGYEPIENFSNELEFDEYDDISLHCLIIHKSSKIPAACVRLVPKHGNIKIKQLPFEKYCYKSLDLEKIRQLNLIEDNECEISRLAIDGRFRRRRNEDQTRFGVRKLPDISKEEGRSFSIISMATFYAAIAMTELNKKNQMFAMMEPFLPRLLSRAGLNFQKVGSDLDYHGIRAPYFLSTKHAIANIPPKFKDLYLWIRKKLDIKKQFKSDMI